MTMVVDTRKPGPPLSGAVDLVWACRGATPLPGREVALPGASVQIVLNLRDEPFRVAGTAGAAWDRAGGALVSGPSSRPVVLDPSQQVTAVGICFEPGQAYRFLPCPMGELLDLHVDLTTLWGRQPVADWRERLAGAGSTERIFDLLEAVLRSRLRPDVHPHRAVRLALSALSPGSAPPPRVAAVAEQTGLSRKRLIEVFRREVGLSPKLFQRLGRFHDVIRRTHGAVDVSLARVAVAAGYADQAHLTREFTEFAGIGPAAYLRRRSTHPNHVPLEA